MLLNAFLDPVFLAFLLNAVNCALTDGKEKLSYYTTTKKSRRSSHPNKLSLQGVQVLPDLSHAVTPKTIAACMHRQGCIHGRGGGGGGGEGGMGYIVLPDFYSLRP